MAQDSHPGVVVVRAYMLGRDGHLELAHISSFDRLDCIGLDDVRVADLVRKGAAEVTLAILVYYTIARLNFNVI